MSVCNGDGRTSWRRRSSSKIEELLGNLLVLASKSSIAWCSPAGLSLWRNGLSNSRRSSKEREVPRRVSSPLSIGTSMHNSQGACGFPAISRSGQSCSPELRASADAEVGSRLIECIRHLAEPRPDRRYRSVAGGSLSGIYLRSICQTGTMRSLFSTGTRKSGRDSSLRSSDNPALQIPEDSGRIGHLPDSKASVFSLIERTVLRCSKRLGNATTALLAERLEGLDGFRHERTWFSANPAIGIPNFDSQSCIITGDTDPFETAYQGMTSVEGV